MIRLAGPIGEACYSECMNYRYVLTRPLQDLLSITNRPTRAVNFIMLNPSTATEQQNDPTIRRCMGYASDWDYDELLITNIFAYRSTDPFQLRLQSDPIGRENNHYLREIAKLSDRIICAWGTHGELNNRGAEVLRLLSDFDLYCLKQTSGDHPSHPLYLKRSLQPVLWKSKGGAK